MKIQKYITTGILAVAALLLAGSIRVQASTPNYVFVDTDPVGTMYDSGVVVAAPGVSEPPGTGSFYFTMNAGATASCCNHPLLCYVALPGDNPYWNGGGTLDFSQYSAVTFDIMWDSSSDLTIDQFNTDENWPADYLASWDTDPNGVLDNGGGTIGMEVDASGLNSGGNLITLGTFNVPEGAASGFVSVTLPYSDTLANLAGNTSIVFQKEYNAEWAMAAGPITFSFWIANLTLVSASPPPPPTVSGPSPATPGLNIFNGTEGNTYYDRNEVLATPTSGLSWVSNTPATYSFTISSFPMDPAHECESYLFLVPNSANEDNAADYNETNCMVLEVQETATGSAMTLSYKTNLPKAEPNISVVTNNSSKFLGQYSLTFTGNDAGYLTAPDGTVTNFTLPGTTAETYFSEQGITPYNFLIYLGGQANDSNAMNQAMVYGAFNMSGPPSSINETFTGETALSSNWKTSFTVTGGTVTTSDPAAVLIVPTNAPYWVNWTLPATGFVLNDTASLSSPNWNTVGTFNPIPLYQISQQLVSQSDLQGPTSAQYFELVDRVFSTNSGSLLVAFPGQTFVNGTGVTGTPTAIHDGGSGAWDPTRPVYVYAVDATDHLVTSVTDGISLYNGGPDEDPISGDFANPNTEATGLSANMVGGIATFNNSYDSDMGWGNNGLTFTGSTNMTIQVVDYTIQQLDSVNITANSAPITLVTP